MEREDQSQHDPNTDLMPEAMDADEQQDTRSVAEKIAGAMEFVIQGQSDTPSEYGRYGR